MRFSKHVKNKFDDYFENKTQVIFFVKNELLSTLNSGWVSEASLGVLFILPHCRKVFIFKI